MSNFQVINISINGIPYHDALGRHVGNIVWKESIIVIKTESEGIAHLQSLQLDSMVDIQDIGVPGTFEGKYQYIGGNTLHYLFRRSEKNS